jgi:hypothetical protein
MPPSTLSNLQPVPLPKKAEQPLPADAVSAIADLREKWQLLHDLDRAAAVRNIIQLGVPRRRLAREMGFSEGLLRHLLKALKASPADQELARRNVISTNQLVRRAEGRPLVRPVKRLPVKAVLPAVPLLKPPPRLYWLRARRTSAPKSIVGGWWNR